MRSGIVDKKMQKFNKEYDQFLFEKDAEPHRKAVSGLLSRVGLSGEYNRILKDKNAVSRFFLAWGDAARKEKDPNEQKSLEKLGKLSEEYFNKKDYRSLSRLFANLAFQNLVDFTHLKEREDFEEITDHDLYEKGLIPKEIYLQFFLLETLSKMGKFDWNRNEYVINQNLACLIVCFGDIYDFFNESENNQGN